MMAKTLHDAERKETEYLSVLMDTYRAWAKRTFPYLPPMDTLDVIGRMKGKREIATAMRRLRGLEPGTAASPDALQPEDEEETGIEPTARVEEAEFFVQDSFVRYRDAAAMPSASPPSPGPAVAGLSELSSVTHPMADAAGLSQHRPDTVSAVDHNNSDFVDTFDDFNDPSIWD